MKTYPQSCQIDITEFYIYWNQTLNINRANTSVFVVVSGTVLPESCVLQFDCGVKVQLGFAAEFSNIMIIYTRILEKPTDITSCSAQLSDFTEVRLDPLLQIVLLPGLDHVSVSSLLVWLPSLRLHVFGFALWLRPLTRVCPPVC